MSKKGMATYYLYFLRDDGGISHVLAVQAESDRDALTAVNGHGHAHLIEIWRDSVLIGVSEPASRDPRVHLTTATRERSV